MDEGDRSCDAFFQGLDYEVENPLSRTTESIFTKLAFGREHSWMKEIEGCFIEGPCLFQELDYEVDNPSPLPILKEIKLAASINRI